MELTMFQRLQELPLFQGLNMNDMSEIVEKVRFDFQQFGDDEVIALQNTRCKQLIFILKGNVRVEYIDPNNRFRFNEHLEAPIVLEPQSMFGMTQNYQRSYICENDCQTLSIERAQFLSVMMNYPIVKLNALNLMCNLLQRSNKKLENISHKDAHSKLIQFLHIYSTTQKGQKELLTTMDTLAEMFEETRLNVSRALKQLNEEGLITQGRKSFTILALENL